MIKILKYFFKIILTFLVVLAFCEVFLKVAKISDLSFADYYNDIGKGIAKNKIYVYFNEGFGIIKTNKFRYIGESIPFEKKDNQIRIALLGDSYIESLQVFERDYFGNIMEDILSNKFKDKTLQIQNFGRTSFNIGNMYAYQKLLVEKFSPDLIIYFLSNDDLEPEYSTPLLPKSIINNDSLKISLDFKVSDLNQYQNTKVLTQNFVFLNILNSCRHKLKTESTASILLGKSYSWFYTNTVTKSISTPFKVNPITKKIIQNLDPKKTIIVNRDSKKLPFKFKTLCVENNLNYIDLSILFDRMKNKNINPTEWKLSKTFGHWTPEAHKAIGNELSKDLKTILNSQ